MDPRIADYIRDNRRRYTKQALIDQLLEAGYSREAIDATWAVLETPDRDSTAGQGFWGRFFLILIGVNVVVLAGVVLLSGMLGGGGGTIVAVILAVVLAIGGLIAWGVVAATQPAKLGPRTALAIGTIIPLLFAFLIGGSCYALVGGISGGGGGGPPPASGTMELSIEQPTAFSASGAAHCSPGSDSFSVFSDEVRSADGRPVEVSIDVQTAPGPEGPAPIAPNLNIYMPSTSPDQQEISYTTTPSSDVSLETDAGPFAGSLTFTDLEPAEPIDPSASPPFGGEPISGTVTWQCQK